MSAEVHETSDGTFVVADSGGWLPGVYDTAETAAHAATRDPVHWQRSGTSTGSMGRGVL